jgi:hypothetical protein
LLFSFMVFSFLSSVVVAVPMDAALPIEDSE